MEPLFDVNAELVGWIAYGEHTFDADMNWVAFLYNGHAWSAVTVNWLGSMNGLHCLDRDGRVVAWCLSQPVEGLVRGIMTGRVMPMSRPMFPKRPMRPVQPMRPVKPLKPMTPLSGWSNLNWNDWLSQ